MVESVLIGELISLVINTGIKSIVEILTKEHPIYKFTSIESIYEYESSLDKLASSLNNVLIQYSRIEGFVISVFDQYSIKKEGLDCFDQDRYLYTDMKASILREFKDAVNVLNADFLSNINIDNAGKSILLTTFQEYKSDYYELLNTDPENFDLIRESKRLKQTKIKDFVPIFSKRSYWNMRVADFIDNIVDSNNTIKCTAEDKLLILSNLTYLRSIVRLLSNVVSRSQKELRLLAIYARHKTDPIFIDNIIYSSVLGLFKGSIGKKKVLIWQQRYGSIDESNYQQYIRKLKREHLLALFRLLQQHVGVELLEDDLKNEFNTHHQDWSFDKIKKLITDKIENHAKTFYKHVDRSVL